MVVGLGGLKLYNIFNTDDLLLFVQNVRTDDLVSIVVRRPEPGSKTPRLLPAGRMRAE